MKIVAAGQDRTADLGAQIAETVRCWPTGTRPAVLPEALSALRLQQTATEAEFLTELLRLLRYRDNVDTLPFEIPRKPGRVGALTATFKAVLWKLFRYQHDRITFRQNLINHLYTRTLEFEHQQYERELGDLRRRIADLEQKAP